MSKMVSNGRITGIKKLSGQPSFCEACALGKMRKLPFPQSCQHASRPLELVHADVMGPIGICSHNGCRFTLVLTENFSKHPWVYTMQHKSECLTKYRKWKSYVCAYFKSEIGHVEPTNNMTALLQTDGGSEFTSTKFKLQLRKDGIIHETTAPYTPEQNGVAEHMNLTLSSTISTIMAESKLPSTFWNKALACSAYIVAHRPTSACNVKSPY